MHCQATEKLRMYLDRSIHGIEKTDSGQNDILSADAKRAPSLAPFKSYL